MNLLDLVGSFSCEKAFNIETWKNVEPDGSSFLPYQHKVQFSLPADQGANPSYLIAKFTGALGNKGELIERTGKLGKLEGLGYGLLFEQKEVAPYAWYFFPVEFAGEIVLNDKKNYLMIMNINNQRIVVKLSR